MPGKANESMRSSAAADVPAAADSSAAAVAASTAASIPVPKAISELLIKLCKGFSPPEELDTIKVTQFHWDGRDFSSSARELSSNGKSFSIKCGGMATSAMEKDLSLLASDKLRNKPIRGELADGRTFQAQFGCTANETTKYGKIDSHEVFVSGDNWNIVPKDNPPSLWFGKIEGKIDKHFVGNLSVRYDADERTRFSSYSNLRLSGTYTYYLICREENWVLVVDAGAAIVPDPHALWMDFLILEFVLGKQLTLQLLYGVDEAGNIVAYAGGHWGEDRPLDSGQSPLPLLSNLEASFFDAISKSSKEQPNLRWGIALQSYLDGFTSNIEVAYLRLQVAVESFSYWILKSRGELDYSLVGDVKKWEKWVKDNKDIIRSHAKSEDDNLATALYLKVKNAHERSTGKLIRDTFKLFQLDTTKEMDQELRSRDLSVHMMQMSPTGIEIDRDVKRVNLVRALLVALIAKAAGYQGAIADQDLLGDGKWWKPDPNAYGQAHYLAEEPNRIQPAPATPAKGDLAIKALLKEVGKGEIAFHVMLPGSKLELTSSVPLAAQTSAAPASPGTVEKEGATPETGGK